MDRRTLLKSALALPLVGPPVNSATHTPASQLKAYAPNALYSGLAGLDYSMGGLKPGELTCFMGSPCTGKTVLLLELATRLVDQYGKDVFFYSANQPLYYLFTKLAQGRGAKTRFQEICQWVDHSEEGDARPAVIMLDFSRDPTLALRMVSELLPYQAGCSALIMDGWSTYRPLAPPGQSPEGVVAFPAERWPHGLISVDILAHASRVGAKLAGPVVFGVTNAPLNDNQGERDSLELETQLRVRLDNLVTLDRPEISRKTAKRKADERDVVCLAGSSRHWWDTRYAKLRFDPRRLGFETVV